MRKYHIALHSSDEGTFVAYIANDGGLTGHKSRAAIFTECKGFPAEEAVAGLSVSVFKTSIKAVIVECA